MLTLTRKEGESIYLVRVEGYDLVEAEMVIREVRGRQVRMGITAAQDTGIYRKEVYNRIKPDLALLRVAYTTSEGYEQAARQLLLGRNLGAPHAIDIEVPFEPARVIRRGPQDDSLDQRV
ncbi:TPA: carbon storage regulator [Candidatus Woesearchaeota archaeon]|nr:carbon storage regulator [Candidatus Woesearchaeota archaeon]